MAHNDTPHFILPISIVSRVDIGRVLRETQLLNDFLEQASIRQPGTPTKLPRTSRLLDEVVQVNQINVLRPEERQRLQAFLKEVRDKAPALHMSFSADPSPLFVKKLVTWLRDEIHPMVLVQIGLQPNIGAGCVVRTTNKFLDFSLRSRLSGSRDILLSKLRTIEDAPTPPRQEQVPAAAPVRAAEEVPA